MRSRYGQNVNDDINDDADKRKLFQASDLRKRISLSSGGPEIRREQRVCDTRTQHTYARTRAYSRLWQQRDAKQRRQPRVTEYSSMFSPRFSRAALRNVYPQRDIAGAHTFSPYHPLPRLSRLLDSRGARSFGIPISQGRSRFSTKALEHRRIALPNICFARHPVQWTIQFLGTVFVCITYPPSCRPIPT